MAIKQCSKQNNAQNYLIALSQALNNYEGASLYFKTMNDDFFHYLDTLLITNDDILANELLASLLRRITLKKHPFLHISLKLFGNKKINERQKKTTQRLLKLHPKYPLNKFIKFALGNIEKVNDSPLRRTRDSDPLLIYYILNHRKELLPSDIKTLNELSLCNYTWASLTLAHHYALHEDMGKFVTFMEKAAVQSGQDVLQFMKRAYKNSALEVGLETSFGQLLADKSISFGNYDLLDNLIEYYEQNDNKTKLLYYLTIAAHQNNETAIEKLILHYKDNKEMVKFLENKLIITKVK